MNTSDLTKVIKPRIKPIPRTQFNALLGKFRTLGATKTDTLKGDHEDFSIYFLPSSRSAYVVRTAQDSMGRKRSLISGPYVSTEQLSNYPLSITLRSWVPH